MASPTDVITVESAHTDAFRARLAGVATKEYGLLVHKQGHLGTGSTQPQDMDQFITRCVGG